MCRKNRAAKQVSERRRKAARDVANQKINDKSARLEARAQNSHRRDTLVEDTALQFAGNLNHQATEEKAVKLATEASEAAFDPSNLFFFTYGASVKNEGTSTNKHNWRNRLAGAAVVYKQHTADNVNGSWRGRQWELGHCETISGAEAGFVAISKSLTLAIEQLRHAQQQDAEPTITIFTHNHDEINRISKVRYIDSTLGHSDAEPVLQEIVKKSQKLRSNFGANVELYCIPWHATMKGNRLAEAAAQKAAISQDLPAATD